MVEQKNTKINSGQSCIEKSRLVNKGKVCIRAKWPIRPELIMISV